MIKRMAVKKRAVQTQRNGLMILHFSYWEPIPPLPPPPPVSTRLHGWPTFHRGMVRMVVNTIFPGMASHILDPSIELNIDIEEGLHKLHGPMQ
jgi:hypothetical protein